MSGATPGGSVQGSVERVEHLALVEFCWAGQRHERHARVRVVDLREVDRDPRSTREARIGDSDRELRRRIPTADRHVAGADRARRIETERGTLLDLGYLEERRREAPKSAQSPAQRTGYRRKRARPGQASDARALLLVAICDAVAVFGHQFRRVRSCPSHRRPPCHHSANSYPGVEVGA